MKTRNKALLLTLCALMLVAASVLGTMAYLTSQDTVTNTFTVGNVSITLDETDVDNSTPNAERDKENSYKLMPGHEYTKDPIVHVDSKSDDCYLFVKVDNQISGIEAENETVADGYKTIASQMAAKGWKAVGTGYDNIYVYVGTAADASNPLAVSASSTGTTDITVFEKIKIADTVNNTTLATYANKTITVTAYAVQKDGFEEKSASEIWAATFGATATPAPAESAE